MLVLDIAVMIGALAISTIAGLGIRALWRRANPEIHGRENAREEAADNERRCHFCKKSTDPDVDLFIDPYWYHRACNRNEWT